MAAASQGRKLNHEILMLEVVEQPKSTGLQFVKPDQTASVECYISGERSTAEKMTYPSILLANHEGPAKLVWYLVSDDAQHPHPYTLEGEDCKDGVCTKIMHVEACGQVLSFPGLYVRSVPTKEMQKILERRIILLKEHLPGTEFIQKDPAEYNPNTARICFHVLPNFEEVLKMVLTRSLHRKDPVLPRNPCILCISQCKGSVHGGEEMSLQVTNLKTDDVLVFFHHESLEPRTSWQAFADIICVSRKKGQPANIVIRTPAYYNQKISKPQTVAIQVRLTDNSRSNTVNFTYTPQTKGPSKIEQKAKHKEPIYVKHFNCLGAVAHSGQVLTADQQNRAEDGADKFDETKHQLMFIVQRKETQPLQIRGSKRTFQTTDCLIVEPMELLEGCEPEKEQTANKERVDYTRIDWYKSLLMGIQSSPPDVTTTTNSADSQHSSKMNISKSVETESKNSSSLDLSSQSSSAKQLSNEVNLQSESSEVGKKGEWPLDNNHDMAKSSDDKSLDSEIRGHSFTTDQQMEIDQENVHLQTLCSPEIVETFDDVGQKDPGFSSPLPSSDGSSPSPLPSTQTHLASDDTLSSSSSLDSGYVPSQKMSQNLSTVHETNSNDGREADCEDSSNGEPDGMEASQSSGSEDTQMLSSTESETVGKTENDGNKSVNESNYPNKRGGDESEDNKENAAQGSHLVPPRAAERIDHKGGKLTLFDGEITLDIPPGALKEGQAENITLTVDWDDGHIPRLRKTDMNVAPIVHCGPTGLKFEKPVTLRIPHCAVVQPDQKGLQMVVHCSHTEEGAMPKWQKVSLLNNPDVDVEYQDRYFVLHITHFTAYSVALPGGTTTAAKEIMAVAYGPEINDFTQKQQIRVYLYDYHIGNRERIHQEELKLGGKQLEGPNSYQFHELNQGKMTVEAEFVTPGWLLKSTSPRMEFSFHKIWNTHSWNRCKFTWSNGSETTEFFCRLGIQQQENGERATLEICNDVKNTSGPNQSNPQSKNDLPASQHDHIGPHVMEQYSQTYKRCMSYGERIGNQDLAEANSSTPLALSFQSSDSGLHIGQVMPRTAPISNIVPYNLQRKLSILLDPPDPLGNNWKMFASKFGYDTFIRNWEICPGSPTSMVLKAIEQERKISTLNDLRQCFDEICRADAANEVQQCIHMMAQTKPVQATDDSQPMSDQSSPDDTIRSLTAGSMDWSSNSGSKQQRNQQLTILSGQKSPVSNCFNSNLSSEDNFHSCVSQNAPLPNSTSTSGQGTPWNGPGDENRNMEVDGGVKRVLFDK